ncbi:MAG TPA: amidophosphoribosyltransferase [Anaerolineae bacterium]|nr:amidophosphoribosyltransferase [Anaerolineae bacterium]
MDFWQDDKPHDECGVFGIYAPHRDVARTTFFGLYALQHRGQESAGIATSDGNTAFIHKGMGLVSQVFNEESIAKLKGFMAIGHNRYSTTGSSLVTNAGPYLIETIYGPLGVAHNGNLTNALKLRYRLLERGVGLSSTTDSEVITQMLAAPFHVWQSEADMLATGDALDDQWVKRIKAFMGVAQGAYSLTMLTREGLYAVRDPLGLRPLCIGELEDGGYVIASETCALQTIGARFLREVRPGEIVRLNEDGLTSFSGRESQQRALCVFEYVYFARPDSILEGQVIHQVRQRMGRQLAREAPADADIVVAVPDSAIPAAIGMAEELGISYMEGLTKNRYIGRTFIQPDDKLRKEGIRIKFNPLRANLEGKRIILVDDSIVRGNTSQALVQLMRDGGAAEVHVRVSSPPVRHPCFMGVDMATYKELIAHKLDVPAIQKQIKADSLAYLSHEGMLAAVQQEIQTSTGHCTACFSGDYPIDIPEWLFEEDRDKFVFELPLKARS